jgi:hypothetical protein
VVVDLGVIVEHDEPLGRMRGECEFDGVGEVVDAGQDRHRLGFGEDGVELVQWCAGLQRYGHGSGQGQRHVDDDVVGAGEAQRRDPVAGLDGGAGQGVCQRLHPCPGLAVGEGVEAGLEFGDGAAGGVGDELDGALAEGGPVGVAGHHRADDVGEQDAGGVDSGADRWVGLCRNQLRVSGDQMGEAVQEPRLALVGWSGHGNLPWTICSCVAVRLLLGTTNVRGDSKPPWSWECAVRPFSRSCARS